MTIVALWATPRTVSTAFERMVIERGDHLVLDEPWSRAYYLGPDRRSDRFPLCFPESTDAAVTAGVLATGHEDQVFVKDMAYQAGPGLGDDDLDAITHTFLIREPGAALRSLARQWPDFTEDEAGYVAQGALFDRVAARTDSTPVVIDSDALRRNPDGVIAAWCRAVGLEHRPEALHWQPGVRPEWPLWTSWYEGVAASTGFRPPAAATPTPTSTPAGASTRPDVDAILARADEVYRRLRAHAITA